jgi:hypothetical protein
MKRRLFCTIFPWFGLGERLFGDTLFRNGKLPEIKKYLDNPNGLPVLRRNMPVGELFKGVEFEPHSYIKDVFYREVLAWIPEGMFLDSHLRSSGHPSFFGECVVHQLEDRLLNSSYSSFNCTMTSGSICYGYGLEEQTITINPHEVANG